MEESRFYPGIRSKLLQSFVSSLFFFQGFKTSCVALFLFLSPCSLAIPVLLYVQVEREEI